MNASNALASATTELTTEDVRELRKADRVIFRHSSTNNKGAIVAKTVRKNDQPDIEYNVQCDSSRGRIYDFGDAATGDVPFDGFAVLESYKFSTCTLETLAANLRKGDRIRLKWVANSSDTMKEAGVHEDHLSVIVVRGSKEREYLMQVQTTLAKHSAARMIRPR